MADLTEAQWKQVRPLMTWTGRIVHSEMQAKLKMARWIVSTGARWQDFSTLYGRVQDIHFRVLAAPARVYWAGLLAPAKAGQG
jgi:hypothetical protein